MASRRVIHDGDPGPADAIALLLELAAPESLDILAVLTVAGTVPLERATENARRIVELAGRADLPVHAGCPRPLDGALRARDETSGASGLEGSGLPPAWLHPETSHAVEYLIDLLEEADEPVTISATGPLTNIASALVAAPAIADKIGALVIAGGAIGRGNATPSAEANFHADPMAAEIVLAAGLDPTLIALDAARGFRVEAEDAAAIERLGNQPARAVAGLLRHGLDAGGRFRAEGALHGILAAGYLLAPELFAARAAHLRAIAWGESDRGRTVELKGAVPNATLVHGVDAAGLWALVLDRLARFGPPKR
ncbi:MAG TPA: nucleoside hydrolase [Alphaproteobacteria bacterium]|nr:nucleoside hydrolase [Alphaproteobacteria bacterium]